MPKTMTRRGLVVNRLPIKLVSDVHRVITLPFTTGAESRLLGIFERVANMPEAAVEATLTAVLQQFEHRHENIREVFAEHYGLAARLLGKDPGFSENRRLLLGSYLTMEYSIEAAALFNPSIVPHPDQSGLRKGAVRFVLSLRATGEGHVSSIVFRTGVIEPDYSVRLDPPPKYSARTRLAPDQHYLKHLFRRKLGEMAVNLHNADTVLERLPEQFTLMELERAIAQSRENGRAQPQFAETVEAMLWLAASNYRLKLKENADISQIVIFPQCDNESRGIEDLRLVRFTDEDGAVSYIGTYTAFNGVRILPMLLETRDFRTIAIHTLNGACAINKGLALFPRRLNGHYAMCSRIDGQNLYIMYSDMLHFWETAQLLAKPKYPWELRLIGNCGSPIETREGWLLMMHGVGPMRRYCIGAMLLDLEDPTKIVGRLKEPLIMPSEEEREGYVPNVVYSCGSMVHRKRLFIPFAMSDEATSMATVALDDLLDQLKADGP